MAKKCKIAIVPGGGKFADMVRKLDKTFGLSDNITHKMAILAMDQYGLFLSDLTQDASLTYGIKEINRSVNGRLQILLPSKLMFHNDPLEHSWNVTSDSIAAYIASLLNAKKLVLVKNVDGIFADNPKQNVDALLIEEISAEELFHWKKSSSVDKTLSKILLETKLDCYVVNGKYPERIKLILKNKKTLCTHITT
jgi:aspartokinase-like uncharacterized kinase